MMYCEKCGYESSLKANFCKKCGSALNKQNESNSVEANDFVGVEIDPKTNRPSIPWPIILFCIAQIFVPIRTLGSIPSMTKHYEYISEGQYGVLVFFIQSALLVALAVASVLVANDVWKVKSNSIRTAKIYLIAVPAVSLIVIPILAYLPDFGSAAYNEMWSSWMIREGIVAFIISAIPSILWYAYFSISKRVAAAYGVKSTWKLE